MADSSQYYWVVLCKNHRIHSRENLFFAHKILLAETDPYVSPPDLDAPLAVTCDRCGKQFSYSPKELLRVQMEGPEDFTPHPVFR